MLFYISLRKQCCVNSDVIEFRFVAYVRFHISRHLNERLRKRTLRNAYFLLYMLYLLLLSWCLLKKNERDIDTSKQQKTSV